MRALDELSRASDYAIAACLGCGAQALYTCGSASRRPPSRGHAADVRHRAAPPSRGVGGLVAAGEAREGSGWRGGRASGGGPGARGRAAAEGERARVAGWEGWWWRGTRGRGAGGGEGGL
jgi:hypothetical protein